MRNTTQKTFLHESLFITILACFSLTLLPKASFSGNSKRKMSIAVLNFLNTNKDAQYNYLSSAIPESLVTFLVKYSKGKVIILEREQIEKIIKEIMTEHSNLTDEESAVEIGKLANATHIIVGSYTIIDDLLRINARLVSVETGEAVLAESVTGKGGKESFKQINKLSANMVESLIGKKIKIEEFKDVQNPLPDLSKITKKQTTIIYDDFSDLPEWKYDPNTSNSGASFIVENGFLSVGSWGSSSTAWPGPSIYKVVTSPLNSSATFTLSYYYTDVQEAAAQVTYIEFLDPDGVPIISAGFGDGDYVGQYYWHLYFFLKGNGITNVSDAAIDKSNISGKITLSAKSGTYKLYFNGTLKATLALQDKILIDRIRISMRTSNKDVWWGIKTDWMKIDWLKLIAP